MKIATKKLLETCHVLEQGSWDNVRMEDFLAELELEDLLSIFEREHITMDVLADMSHADLSSIGVTAFGHRHRLLRKVRELAHTGGAEPGIPLGVATASHVGTQLIELPSMDKDYVAVSEEVRNPALVIISKVLSAMCLS